MRGDSRSTWWLNLSFSVGIPLRSVVFKLEGLSQQTPDELSSDRDQMLRMSTEHFDLNIAGVEIKFPSFHTIG